MKPISFLLVVLLVPAAAGVHQNGVCVVTSAPSGSYITRDVPVDLDGDTRIERFYVEAREEGFVPFTDRPWVYEESWGYATFDQYDLSDTLQRGGVGILGDWFPPGCDQNPDWSPTDGSYPCLIMDEDPISDETCGHGPDFILM